ncbi:MAG: hypothetical protein ACXWC8_08440 [Limisphaerales bacterium]
MQTIIHIRDGLWSNLALIAFMLGLAALAVFLDYRFHGEVNIVVWFFAAIFVLFCGVPINSIRKPRSRLLVIDGDYLLWRIYNRKTGAVGLERRVPLSSIHGLKWVVPKHAQEGHDQMHAQLRFITAERNSLTLPDEFFAARYRRRIETALKQKLPTVKIVEELA